MPCPKCKKDLLTPVKIYTDDGSLTMLSCLCCGEAIDRVVLHNRAHPPTTSDLRRIPMKGVKR